MKVYALALVAALTSTGAYAADPVMQEPGTRR